MIITKELYPFIQAYSLIIGLSVGSFLNVIIYRLPNNKSILLGITGDDWTYGNSALPTAWRITLVDSKENTIAEKSSQVWSL